MCIRDSIKRAEESRKTEDIREAFASLEGYGDLADRLAAGACGKGYANNVEYVMDPQRVRRFKEDCERTLRELEAL